MKHLNIQQIEKIKFGIFQIQIFLKKDGQSVY